MTNSKLSRPKFVFAVLCCVNLFNFIDRGIIPGSTVEFNSFIESDIKTSTPDVYLGLLQSSFIVGFVIGSIIFGHLIHYYERFYLAGVGMTVWIVAVLLSGLSYSTGSYACLFVARMFSGFGEASLQCTAPPWIEAVAPSDSKGTWLSIFYTAIPVGTALGYAYSSLMSASIGCQYAFFLEAIIVTPLVMFLFHISSQYPRDTHPQNDETTGGNSHNDTNMVELTVRNPLTTQSTSDESDLELVESHHTVDDGTTSGKANSKGYIPLICEKTPLKHPTSSTPPSFLEECKAVLSSPVYLCVIFANAAQTATLMGVSTFGSAFMMGLGYFSSESQASTVFGVLISIAGVVGTPLGGVLLDRAMRDETKTKMRVATNSVTTAVSEKKKHHVVVMDEFLVVEKDHTADDLVLMTSELDTITVDNVDDHTSSQTLRQMNRILAVVYWSTLAGTILLALTYFILDCTLYLLVMCVGCTLIFFTYPGINIAVMLSTPTKHRSFAIGMSCVVGHAFGDVPSPILVGFLKDYLAPHCAHLDSGGITVDDASNVANSAACHADSDGLRMTMFIVFIYMYVAVIFFAGGWYFNAECVPTDRSRPRSS